MNKKITDTTEIKRIVKELKLSHKKIVTYNGNFDILHLGHLKSIQEAKRQGDVLVILINSDASIKLYKGPNRPIMPEGERAETLALINEVDYVILFDEINPKKVLSEIAPNVHCNGSDWGENCVERSVVEENGGEIYILSWEKGLSTTNIIKRIINLYKIPTVRSVFLDRDGVINDNKSGYVYRIEDFEFLPGALDQLKKLSVTNYKLIIITNQSGIGRNYYTHKDFEKLNRWMLREFKKKDIRVDKVYFCPHKPEENCDCRKPKIGMLTNAVKDFDISLNDSWLIGNDEKDVIMCREANVKTIKLGKKMSKNLKLEPSFYAKDLSSA